MRLQHCQYLRFECSQQNEKSPFAQRFFYPQNGVTPQLLLFSRFFPNLNNSIILYINSLHSDVASVEMKIVCLGMEKNQVARSKYQNNKKCNSRCGVFGRLTSKCFSKKCELNSFFKRISALKTTMLHCFFFKW